jgi:hypothetical protein
VLAAAAWLLLTRLRARARSVQAHAGARHIPKRARRDKGTEAVFDEKARRCAQRRACCAGAAR